MSRIFLALAVLALAACQDQAATPAPKLARLRVAAASDLGPAFGEIGALYEARYGRGVDFSFGSSGLLAKQLAAGAPFDVFAAANVAYVDDAVRAGACRGDSQAIFAHGRLVVWTPEGIEGVGKLDELRQARFHKIAIANPEHAPYGKAAQQALTAAGLWDALHDRLVFAENVRQAQQLAETGNVEAALVARSLVLGSEGENILLVDESMHQPIDQAIAACTRGPAPAAAPDFLTLLRGEDGRAILVRYGFTIPAAVVPQQ